VDFAAKTATVVYIPAKTSPAQLARAAAEETGFTVTPRE